MCKELLSSTDTRRQRRAHIFHSLSYQNGMILSILQRMVKVGWVILRSYVTKHLLKQGIYSNLSKTTSRWLLNVSEEEDSTASLSNLFQCSITLPIKHFLMFRQNFPCSSFHSLLLVLPLDTTWLHLLCIFPSDIHWWDPPETSWGFTGPGLLPLLIGEMLQSLHHICGPSLNPLCACMLMGCPELDTSLQMWLHQCGIERKNFLPWLGNVNVLPSKTLFSCFCFCFVARIHSWLIPNWCSPGPPHPSACKSAFQLCVLKVRIILASMITNTVLHYGQVIVTFHMWNTHEQSNL